MNIIKNKNLLSSFKLFLNSKRNSFQQNTIVELLSHNQDIRTIKKISPFGFRLNNGTFAIGPIVLFNEVCLSWNVISPKEIHPKSLSLFRMYEPKFEILVLGVGDDLSEIDPKLIPYLTRNKVPFEIHRTLDAAKLYNYLVQDKRHVAAALIPPTELTVPRVTDWLDDDISISNEFIEMSCNNEMARGEVFNHFLTDIINKINHLHITKEQLKQEIAQKNKELKSKEYLFGDKIKDEINAIEEYEAENLKKLAKPKEKQEVVKPLDNRKLIK